MLLMIDNYDSFTWNLVQYLQALGAEVRVERNDALTVDAIARLAPERIVIVTDEQSHDALRPLPAGTKGYVMNVAPYQNGIAWGRWTTISGFSENLVKFIVEVEASVAADVSAINPR